MRKTLGALSLEEVLGAQTDPATFEDFLENWESVLSQRVEETVAAFANIPGVCGLILAGSVGRGEAWPLSDIDLLPIYDDHWIEATRVDVERRRREPLERWVTEGWWSGIDIGNLVFSRAEVTQTFAIPDCEIPERLQDNRWYHSLDKGYRGRAVYDPHGLASKLVQWFTANRFRPEVVALRLTRERSEVERAVQRLQESRATGDLLGATKALLAAVHWLRIWLLERWGERDNSLARVGTRFERLANARGRHDLVGAINNLCDLDTASADQRMPAAPWWVWERHDRQWHARRHVGEDVTRAEDIRDVLRVSVQYAIREVTVPPFPAWLAIPADLDALDAKINRLTALVQRCFAEEPPYRGCPSERSPKRENLGICEGCGSEDSLRPGATASDQAS